ncbi:MAG: hypothetical protein NC299_05700 [Lachnospiraceae bacterium]|nr:hypothetical protein [Ruminococcus sp.]MCM1274845.1 hypothetical protein [Lachnospiraceae bacterium]
MSGYDEILRLFNVTNPVGYTAEEIKKAKSVVGVLPLELERFYLLCGASKELHGLQDELILPDRFADLAASDYIVFFIENQSVCMAGVKKSDAALDDPPVYASVDNGEWKLSSPRVSEFLCAMFGYQASICLEFDPEEFFFITAEEKAKVEKLFPKLGGFDNWLYDQKITVYGENGGRVALMEEQPGGEIWMSIAANNEREHERIMSLLDGVGVPM